MERGGLKFICLGDAMVGKTSMIMAYKFDQFPENAPPTVFDEY